MRILYVTPYVPSQIRVRPYNLIKQLAKRNEVTLIALVQNDMDRSALKEISDYCENVYVVNMSRQQSIMSCAKRLFTKMPLQAAYTYLPSFMRIVDETIKSQHFDIVHVEHIRGAHFASHINELPKIYDSVDCITLLLQQCLETKRNPLSWFLTLEEWAKMRVYEGMISQKFDKVVITSARDKVALDELIKQRISKRLTTVGKMEPSQLSAEELEEWRVTRHLIEMAQEQRLESLRSEHQKISVVPNGVDYEYFQPQQNIKEEPETIVFSGKMSYYANIQAVQHFSENILPLIRAKLPMVRFKITGAEPAPAVMKLANQPGIEVTGYVEDIRPHIASASVAVCPIGVGVGIQNKVLEAMAMGKPVVASIKACSAIDAVNGTDLVTAESAQEFADGVVRLLGDGKMRRWMGDNAVRYVTENHSWQALTRRLEDVYREAHLIFEEKRLAGASRGG